MEREAHSGRLSRLIIIMILIVAGTLIGVLGGSMYVYKQIQAGALDQNTAAAH